VIEKYQISVRRGGSPGKLCELALANQRRRIRTIAALKELPSYLRAGTNRQLTEFRHLFFGREAIEFLIVDERGRVGNR
jgi:hypothetical protein